MRISPLLADLRHGGLPGLGADTLAGTITAILLIPQALAYALLAGLPPQIGLYASVLPVIAYALLGSSRTLAVGPVAVAAVMVSSALTAYAGDDVDKYLTGALLLSALTGVMLLGMAALRLGWLANFISHPVLSGFTTAAAITIIGTQIPALTGLSVARDALPCELLTHLAEQWRQINPAELAWGVAALMLLVLARQPLVKTLTRVGVAKNTAAILSRTAPLVLVIIATLLSTLLDTEARHGVRVVGAIPQGIPLPTLGFIASDGWMALLPSAAMIAVVGYIESISVAKVLAFRRRERIDPDRELLALGGANLAAAFAGAMPVAGGFARSMVNFDAGARTQLAAIVTAVWVALGAFFFTGLIAALPKSVLAALIVVAVWQLIDLHHLRMTWAFDRTDGVAQVVTIVGVLALGIEPGLLLGAGTALALFLYRTSRPHIAVVGRMAGSEHFRNIRRHPVQTFPGVLLLRVDESLYFANAPFVENELQTRILETPNLRAVVLIMSGVNGVDSSGLEVLTGIERVLAETGVALHLAEVKGPVMDRLAKTDLLRKLAPAHIHLSAQDAVNAVVGGPQG